MKFGKLPATSTLVFMHYSWGRSAISISWSDFPLVSTTFLFTNATAIKQNVAKAEYRSCGPIFANNCRKSNPTKKFITWKALMDQWTTGSARHFEHQIEFQGHIIFLYTDELNCEKELVSDGTAILIMKLSHYGDCPQFRRVWKKKNPTGNPTYLATNFQTLWARKTSI